MLIAIGRGEIAADEVLRTVDPELAQNGMPKRRTITRNDEGWFNLRRVTSFKFRWPGILAGDESEDDGKGIPIRSVNGTSIINIGEGGAVPGERIVGILDPGKGITIYPIHSPHLRAYEDQLDRWIDVTWDIKEGATELFPARIQVTAVNEPGSLGRIASVIGAAGANIDKLQMMNRARDYTQMTIDVEVLDLKHLTDMLNGVKNLSVVSAASRILA